MPKPSNKANYTYLPGKEQGDPVINPLIALLVSSHIMTYSRRSCSETPQTVPVMNARLLQRWHGGAPAGLRPTLKKIDNQQ
jgi:hypothetical protein